MFTLREETNELQSDIDQLYKASKARQKEMRLDIQGLLGGYERTNRTLDSVLIMWDNAETLMTGVIQHLDAIFTVTECSNAPIVRLLGMSTI